MVSFLFYLLQVSLWFIPLYLLYLTIYKRFTFFRLNRLYLLGIVFASFVLPNVQYEQIKKEIIFLTKDSPKLIAPIPTEPNQIENIPFAAPVKISLTEWIKNNMGVMVFSFYCLVAFILFCRFFQALLKIKKAIQASRVHWENNLALVYTNKMIPHSSFFRYIFLSEQQTKQDDRDKIILHEMLHFEKLHSIDILLTELLKIILWFNPFVYWHKQSLQEVHEFEVDAEMTKLCNEVSYAELLLKVATNNQNNLVHHFSTKPLKTRMKMIFNRKTYPMKKLSFLLVIPLIGILLMAYGNIRQKKVSILKQTDTPFTILIDAGHGGTDKGAVGINNQTEKDISLAIAKLLKIKAENAGYKVILSRGEDQFVDLKSRTAITVAEKIDLLISIHLNNVNNDPEKNGIEYFAGNNNNPAYARTSKIAGASILKSLKDIKGISTDEEAKSRNVGIWVLKAANCPSVLLELGYLSNANDLQFITDLQNQNIVADKIVEGMTRFFMTPKPDVLPSKEEWDAEASNAKMKKNYPDTLYWIKKETKQKPKQKIKSSKTAVLESTKPEATKKINFDVNPWLKPIKKDNC